MVRNRGNHHELPFSFLNLNRSNNRYSVLFKNLDHPFWLYRSNQTEHGYFFKVKNLFKASKRHYIILPELTFLFKVNDRNTRKRCEIFSALTIKAREQRQLTNFFLISIVDFEQVNFQWATVRVRIRD